MITECLAGQIIVRLEAKHSPEQISGGLALTGQQVSTSTIYKHIGRDKAAGGQLHLNLRLNGRRRYRHRNKASRVKIPNRRDISASERREPGEPGMEIGKRISSKEPVAPVTS